MAKNKISKIISVLERKNIFLLDGLNNRLFTDKYYEYLKKQGVNFNGRPNYISSKAYIDGAGYNIISIGKDVVISRNVTLLTHDFSIETAFHSIGKGTDDRHLHINEPIIIGDNCFIGANATILPGSTIGTNSIIGACAVVKGTIPCNSVVVGNPARIVGKTDELAYRYQKSDRVKQENI